MRALAKSDHHELGGLTCLWASPVGYRRRSAGKKGRTKRRSSMSIGIQTKSAGGEGGSAGRTRGYQRRTTTSASSSSTAAVSISGWWVAVSPPPAAGHYSQQGATNIYMLYIVQSSIMWKKPRFLLARRLAHILYTASRPPHHVIFGKMHFT